MASQHLSMRELPMLFAPNIISRTPRVSKPEHMDQRPISDQNPLDATRRDGVGGTAPVPNGGAGSARKGAAGSARKGGARCLIQTDRLVGTVIQLGRPPCLWQAGQGARRLVVRNLLRVRVEKRLVIKDLHREDLSISEIARRIGSDRKTIPKILGKPLTRERPRRARRHSQSSWCPRGPQSARLQSNQVLPEYRDHDRDSSP
jgi:hypothetical protein